MFEDLLEKENISTKEFGGFIKSQKEQLDSKVGELILVTDEEGNPVYEYALRYEEFIAPMIKLIQEQNKRIEDLTQQLRELKEIVEM